MRYVLRVEGDRAPAAYILAAVSQTAAAGVGDFVAAYGALITGNVDDLDHIGIGTVAAHGQTNAFRQDGALLVNTAAHGGLSPGNDRLGDIQHMFHQRAVPRLPGHLTQHLVFQMLYFGIKLTHSAAPSSLF